MDTLPSRIFRTTYPRLTQPTTVTVLGHVIGVWPPAQLAVPDDAATLPAQPALAAPDAVTAAPKTGRRS